MIKLLLWILIIFIAVFAFFGLLICIEYLKYWKRLLVLKLRLKYFKASGVLNND